MPYRLFATAAGRETVYVVCRDLGAGLPFASRYVPAYRLRSRSAAEALLADLIAQ